MARSTTSGRKSGSFGTPMVKLDSRAVISGPGLRAGGANAKARCTIIRANPFRIPPESAAAWPSKLPVTLFRRSAGGLALEREDAGHRGAATDGGIDLHAAAEIGRASCRER